MLKVLATDSRDKGELDVIFYIVQSIFDDFRMVRYVLTPHYIFENILQLVYHRVINDGIMTRR